MKKALAVLGDSASESGRSEHHKDKSILTMKEDEDRFSSMFAFTATSEEEDVTFYDHIKNFNVYSIKKMKNLASVSIDFITELKLEKGLMNNNLTILYK